MGKFTFIAMGTPPKLLLNQIASVNIPVNASFTPTTRGLYRIANHGGGSEVIIMDLYDSTSAIWRAGNPLSRNVTFITDGANLRLRNAGTIEYILIGWIRFDLEISKTEGNMAAGEIMLLPKGFLSYVSEFHRIYPEIFDGASWFSYLETNGARACNFLISDGINVRIRNTDTVTRRYVYILGV